MRVGVKFSEYGIEFRYKGDELIWTWPWKRRGRPKYISILASGNGSIGDARFKSLKQYRQFWKDYDEATAMERVLAMGCGWCNHCGNTGKVGEQNAHYSDCPTREHP